MKAAAKLAPGVYRQELTGINKDIARCIELQAGIKKLLTKAKMDSASRA